MLFLDGVYIERCNGSTRFRWVKAPTSAELTLLAHTIANCAATRSRIASPLVIFEPLGKLKAPDEAQDQTLAERRAAMTWAQRLKRVFNIDIETCGECGGAMKVVACARDGFAQGLLAFGKLPHRYRLHARRLRSGASCLRQTAPSLSPALKSRW